MRPRGSSISVTPQAFVKYQSIGSSWFLGSPGESLTHCPFPVDGVPLGVTFRGSQRGETSGERVLRVGGTSSRSSGFECFVPTRMCFA
jgi:hypothetical protein